MVTTGWESSEARAIQCPSLDGSTNTTGAADKLVDYFLVATEVDPFDGCLLLLVDILRLGDLLPDLLLLVELPEAIDGELPAYVPFNNLGSLG